MDISSDPTRSEQNPSLFYGPDQAVWTLYTAQLDRQAGKDNMQYTAVIRLQSGRIAIAYNPTCAPDPQPGKAAWPGLRCPVAIALSEDEGKTFPLIRFLERGEGYEGEENRTNNHQYEYPYLMQTHDGMLHLVYAAYTRAGIKYVRTTEQDVMGSRRERVGLYNPTAAQIR